MKCCRTMLLILGMMVLTSISASAAVGDVRMVVPAVPPPPGGTVIGEIMAEIGEKPLGSYQLKLQYDGAVLNIASIQGGTTMEFSGVPVHNTADYTDGEIILAAAQAAQSVVNTTASLARVTFTVIGAAGATSPLTLANVLLADATLDTAVIPSNPISGSITVGSEQPTEGEGEGEESEGETPNEGEQPAEGEGEQPAEGEGEQPTEGEGETPNEGEQPAEGEGEQPAEGEGEEECTGEKPAPPQNVKVQFVYGEAGRLDLSWEASAGATGYRIYRRKAWSEEEYVLIGEAEGITYTDTTAPAGDNDYMYPDGCFAESLDCMGCINSDSNPGCYYPGHLYGQYVEYYVTAYNACGESLPSGSSYNSAWKDFSLKSMLLRNGDSLLFLGVLVGLAAFSKRSTKGLALPM